MKGVIMKRIITTIIIVSLGLIITGCNNNLNNDNKENNNKILSETIDNDIINKLLSTNKIIIKMNGSNKILGTITNTDTINEVLDIIKNAKMNGDVFNCDGYGFNFQMFNNNKLIDTIHIWTYNERLIPSSIEQGCSYYTVTSNDNSIKKIIEKNSDYIFYTIYDYSESCDSAEELIYEDKEYKYYLNCIKSDKVFIEFTTSNNKITLKEALNKNYIDPSKILETYPHILIKKKK